jgi:hypothetical protein
MTMILQLNPPIPVVTPRGKGIAHFLLDYGMETSSLWGVFDNISGQMWWTTNEQVRAQRNISMGRNNPEIPS